MKEPDRWLGIELRHLAALEAVAETKAFGRAAEKLGYTQSAVSQQIATLEKAVGERLVERPGGPRPVSLTQAGELLLQHAREITARLSAARADLAALSDGARGQLRVGTYQSVGTRILPALMRRFATSWPNVEVLLTESADDADLLRFVERGELDLTFTVLPLPEGPLEGLELMRDPWVLLAPADAEMADAAGQLRADELTGLRLIGGRNCRSADMVEEHLRLGGADLSIVFRSDDNGTVQGLVGAGVGSALMPRLAVDPHDAATVAVDLDVSPRLIALAWHRDRYHTPAARAFVDTAREICAEVTEGALLG
jgi:DNA-binding transcriptional LysR family regulator